ncbi:DUF4304 domain-containing protein [Tsukamurella ocularis]|uniref:DUF4304 domain-containing protein n=1 Tax=Tsukamurella ocularis TaxID=1970234 RepID=UPI00216956F6|nr:DUF4304 domain-containing protein [Tsukamurella ocularis]MCS3780025.1 hypothetical protein [Tsukamurella ocularis]MCS3849785.1 hypothetical protein [Tsukamurella ocularis]
MSQSTELNQLFDEVLSQGVRPLLREHGFVKSGRSFTRRRGPIYDRIHFQGSSVNSYAPPHRFYVNVDVGSTDIDDAYLGWNNDRRLKTEPILTGRWEQFVDGAPDRVEWDLDTDQAALIEMIRQNVLEALAVIDPLSTTAKLVDWGVAEGGANHLAKLSAYLVTIGDLDTLTIYISRLYSRWSEDSRWPMFSGFLRGAIGEAAEPYIARGLLDDGSGLRP